MIRFLFLQLVLLYCFNTILAQYADPAIGGAFFEMDETLVNSNTTLTFNVVNSGSTPIPAGSIEVNISSAFSYYTSDGVTTPISLDGLDFTWTYLGMDTWRGVNNSEILAFQGGNIQLSFNANQVSSFYEITSINIQPINNFDTFLNSPFNDNLQIGLRVDNNSGPISLSAKVFLQGSFPFGGNLMYDSLRSKELLPLTEPYTDHSGFNHVGEGGGEQTTTAVLQTTGNDAIVDWVFVELRSATDLAQVISTRAALVQRDGDIVDTDGISMLTFSSTSPASYFIAVRHRNHLGAMTANPYALSITPTLVDFTTLNDIGTNGVHAQKDLLGNGSVWGLWTGNTTYDKFEIFQGIDNDPNSIFFDVTFDPENTDFLANYIKGPVYSNADVNMDGQVIFQGPNNEPNYIFFNVLSYPANLNFISNYIMQEQLP